MSDVPATTAIRPRRRWLRRVVAVVVLFIGLPAAYYLYARWSLANEIARAVAETDQLDPRWRLEDIEADRNVFPDEENSALHAIKVVRLIGRNDPLDHRDYDKIFANLPPQAQLNEQQFELIQAAFEKLPEALIEARKFKDMRGGRFPVTFTVDWVCTLVPIHQEVRRISTLLQLDAMHHAHQGDLDQAVASCVALLHSGRSFGDDPLWIAVIMRGAGIGRLAETVERVLAQGQAGDAALEKLQECVAREGSDLAANFLNAVRGERAGHHRFHEALYTGKFRFDEYLTQNRARIGVSEWFAGVVPAMVTKDYPQHLRHMNELVAAAQLPMEEQLDRFIALESRVNRNGPWKDTWRQILPLVPPDLTKMCKNHLRAQANLAATEGGLACERFRLMKGRWPESLEEVVQAEKLDRVPTDPIDGKALRFKRLQDGVAIYSVDFDRHDNGGNFVRTGPLKQREDIGIRLWDPAQRRQPPAPPVALER